MSKKDSDSSQGEITFEKLKRFLLEVGFDQSACVSNTLAFHHRESGALVMLSIPKDGKSVRPADLLSVLIRLENYGLVSQSVLGQFKRGKLPMAS